MICPCCSATIFPEDYGLVEAEFKAIKYSTADCPVCDGTLLVVNGELKDFHKAINEECKDWPADGKGTHKLELEV